MIVTVPVCLISAPAVAETNECVEVSLDVPISIVNVSASTTVTSTHSPLIGSVCLGYVWFVALLS